MRDTDIQQQQRELRQVLAGILKNTFDTIEDTLNELDARDRLTFIVNPHCSFYGEKFCK